MGKKGKLILTVERKQINVQGITELKNLATITAVSDSSKKTIVNFKTVRGKHIYSFNMIPQNYLLVTKGKKQLHSRENW